jgi:hypothetical protein
VSISLIATSRDLEEFHFLGELSRNLVECAHYFVTAANYCFSWCDSPICANAHDEFGFQRVLNLVCGEGNEVVLV